MNDSAIFNLIEEERQRQLKGIELIASENFVSEEVMKAMGSCMTNKYAEGYPGKRYYGGCEVVDQSEQLAIDRIKQLFGAEWANVQPHSGHRLIWLYSLLALSQETPSWGSISPTEVTSLTGRLSIAQVYSIAPSSTMYVRTTAE